MYIFPSLLYIKHNKNDYLLIFSENLLESIPILPLRYCPKYFFSVAVALFKSKNTFKSNKTKFIK